MTNSNEDFVETIKDEHASVEYLKKFKFNKYLNRINKKLKGKTIVLYGAGVFLEAIKKHYDLSGLNIIGITDKRFIEHKDDETFLGYKVYNIPEVRKLHPDYILVSTKMYINIMEELCYIIFKNEKINIKPLVKKDIFTLLKEIWC